MDAFQAYKLYLAVKLHFTRKDYDVVKSRGAVRVSPDSFQKSSMRSLISAVAPKFNSIRDAVQFYVPHYAYRADMFDRDQSNAAVVRWQKHKAMMTHLILEDLPKVDLKKLDRQVKCGTINVETATALYKLYGEKIQQFWDEEDSPIYADSQMLIRKLQPFIAFSEDKVRSAMGEIDG